MQSQNENKNRIVGKKTLLAIIMAVILLVGFTAGYYFNYFTRKSYIANAEIIRIIQQNGIESRRDEEGQDLSTDELAKFLVAALLEDDKYAEYYTEEEYKKITQNNDGLYSGIGVSVADGNVIVKVTGNSPASKSGIFKGDVLIAGKKLDSDFVTFDGADNSLTSFIDSIAIGEKFELKLLREGEEKVVSIYKENYTASYVTYIDKDKKVSLLEDSDYTHAEQTISKEESEIMKAIYDDVSFIRLDGFHGDASIQFEKAIKLSKSSGRKKIILDLRDNGGGSLDVMLEIASFLIYNNGESSSKILYAQEKSAVNGEERGKFYSTASNKYSKENFEDIIVLANENTASASECLINAMWFYGANVDQNFSKDNNVIIEKNADGVAKTYGKGKMQTTYKLSAGGALKLTTANLYAPDKNTSVQDVGFTTTYDNSVDKGDAVKRALQIYAPKV